MPVKSNPGQQANDVAIMIGIIFSFSDSELFALRWSRGVEVVAQLEVEQTCMYTKYFPLILMGGQAEGQAGADPGARSHICLI